MTSSSPSILQRAAEPRALAGDRQRASFSATARRTRARSTARERRWRAHARARRARSTRQRYAPARRALRRRRHRRGRVARAVAHAFGDWQRQAPRPRAPTRPARGAHDRDPSWTAPGSVQTEIRVGHVGVPRTHPRLLPTRCRQQHPRRRVHEPTQHEPARKARLHLRRAQRLRLAAPAGPFLVQTAVATDVTGRARSRDAERDRRLREGGATEEELSSRATTSPASFRSSCRRRSSSRPVSTISSSTICRSTTSAATATRCSTCSADDVLRARAASAPDRFAVVVVGDAKRRAAARGARPRRRRLHRGRGASADRDMTDAAHKAGPARHAPDPQRPHGRPLDGHVTLPRRHDRRARDDPSLRRLRRAARPRATRRPRTRRSCSSGSTAMPRGGYMLRGPRRTARPTRRGLGGVRAPRARGGDRLVAGTIEYLTAIYTTPGFTDEQIHLYLATRPHRGTVAPDADEFLSTVRCRCRRRSRLIDPARSWTARRSARTSLRRRLRTVARPQAGPDRRSPRLDGPPPIAASRTRLFRLFPSGDGFCPRGDARHTPRVATFASRRRLTVCGRAVH